MMVEHLPKFISSEIDKHSFLFDKNSRFIYICRNNELMADSSLQNLIFDKKKVFIDNVMLL
ncbi:hypothetical protein M3Y98_00427200 [Aphelenchoides besseyi]|nr:hypothetical protein M3Y98_00427200 [Aphelenchoides besseyi]KAI6202201.1 hypothetical protein M3Y96_00923300 [Aphelenchoides besseyi]